MDQSANSPHQTDEPYVPFWMKQTVTRCWFCGKPRVTGKTLLGAAAAGGGTPVAVCADGTGCRDGRVRHGPPATVGPHWTSEPCEICDAEHRRRERMATNRTGYRPRRKGTNSHE